MKFSTLLVLALIYAASASAAESSSFQANNAKEAEKLTAEFAKLTPKSPCNAGQQACVEKKFAQCVGGSFQLTECSSGTECAVLPLVNKPGTSITCDTPADQKARLAAASGQNSPPAGDSSAVNPQPSGDNPPPSGNSTDPAVGNNKKGKGKKSKKNKKNKKGNKKDKNNKNNDNQGQNNGASGQVDNNQGQNNGTSSQVNDNQEQNNGTSTTSSSGNKGNNGANIQQQNAAEAESLQTQFDKLTPDSSCKSGENACVDKKFAQCVNGKFALTDCGSGLECAALPLVLKKGTTVACTTDADRTARINAAKSAKN